MGKFGVVYVDVPDGEAFEDLFKRDLAFETGQGGTQAEVHAVSEAHDLVGFAMNVERVTVGENAFVAVGRGGEAQQNCAGRNRAALEFDITSGHARNLM